MSSNQPTISIITVCYNAEATIEKTIKSVIAQDYPAIEYIIVDGLSSDNTLGVVNRYKEHIATVISEKDKNTFDAMNKGLAAATGDYVWYVHADDQIFAADTLSKAMQNHQGEDFVYGKAMLVNEAGEERPLEERKPHPAAATLSWKSCLNGMIICHQAMLVKRSIAPPYDLAYPLVGDLDWVIRILKKAESVRDADVYMCRFVEGGISTKHRKASLRQRFAILKKHFGLLPTLWQHFLITVRALRRGTVR